MSVDLFSKAFWESITVKNHANTAMRFALYEWRRLTCKRYTQNMAASPEACIADLDGHTQQTIWVNLHRGLIYTMNPMIGVLFSL